MSIFSWLRKTPDALTSNTPDISKQTKAAPAKAETEKPMSFFSTVAKDFKAVFTFLGSAKGQAMIATGEGVAEAVDPALSGLFTIANSFMTQALQVESLAVAAGSQAGSDTTKAAAVISAVTPQVLQYFPKATQAQIQTANDAIVAFLNAFDVTPAPVTPVVAAPVVA